MNRTGPAEGGDTAPSHTLPGRMFYDTLWVLCRTLGVALFGIRYRHPVPGLLPEAQAEAVADMEGLQFVPLARPGDAPVGEHTVDVEEEETDPRQARLDLGSGWKGSRHGVGRNEEGERAPGQAARWTG